MTPEERDHVKALFDRLASLEAAPRDGEAERAIAEGLRTAPHAVYALVQTALVQDEALKRADARIRALEAELNGDEPKQGEGGFLDNMREALFGRDERPAAPRGSVPSVRPGEAPMGVPRGFERAPDQGQPTSQPGYETQGYGRGGSFLGTAAASAAGVIGGALLLDSIRGMFGGGRAHAAYEPGGAAGSPWGGGGGGGGDASGSGLAREAGLGDIGSSGGGSSFGGGERAGLFDAGATGDDDFAADDADYDDDGADDGGFDDSDVA